MARHPLGICSMNKGKPGGFKAETKKEAGVKSTSHERMGTSGAGRERTERKQSRTDEVHPGGDGGAAQNAGGPEHRGGSADEDRNP